MSAQPNESTSRTKVATAPEAGSVVRAASGKDGHGRATKRDKRLNAPRTISDPDHGALGTIQRIESEPSNSKGLRWKADDKDGLSAGLHKTARIAINALCDRAGTPRWFPRIGA